jgi:hypothetical protein
VCYFLNRERERESQPIMCVTARRWRRHETLRTWCRKAMVSVHYKWQQTETKTRALDIKLAVYIVRSYVFSIKNSNSCSYTCSRSLSHSFDAVLSLLSFLFYFFKQHILGILNHSIIDEQAWCNLFSSSILFITWWYYELNNKKNLHVHTTAASDLMALFLF